MPSKTIFLTGATGFIGRTVTSLAVSAGYTVRGLSRQPSSDTLLHSLGATPVRGTLQDIDLLARESHAADIVIHLAFDHDFTKPYDQILQLEIGAVNALAAPLVDTDKPLVTTSGTIFYVPDPEGGETDEGAAVAEHPVIKRHLADRNALLWAEKGVRAILVRLPQYVYGRGNRTGFLAQLVKMAVAAGESVYLGDGEYCCSDVYVDDAARLYLDIVAEESKGKVKAGDVFNCTGHTNTTYKALATAIGNLARVPVKSISVEEANARWGAFLVSFFAVRNRASSRKAREVLGWAPVGPDIYTEIEEGSYVEVAEAFRKEGSGGSL